ncbi:hypothetical protein, partial [Porphyromonas sp.]|uniref:hypothetical protein n=1 Tax=Porphyromonas sp. TaxID=1924944 RepID=UPI0025CFD821
SIYLPAILSLMPFPLIVPHVDEKHFLRSFISFLRSFISSLRGKCFFATWGFENIHVGIYFF